MNPSPTGFVTGRELTPGTPTAIYFSWTKSDQGEAKKNIFTINQLSINLHAGYTWSILINSVWNEFHIYFFLVCKILIVSFTWTRVCVTWSRFRILTWAAACRYGMYWSGLWAVPTRRATGAPFPNTMTTGAWMIHVNEIHTCRFKTD